MAADLTLVTTIANAKNYLTVMRPGTKYNFRTGDFPRKNNFPSTHCAIYLAAFDRFFMGRADDQWQSLKLTQIPDPSTILATSRQSLSPNSNGLEPLMSKINDVRD